MSTQNHHAFCRVAWSRTAIEGARDLAGLRRRLTFCPMPFRIALVLLLTISLRAAEPATVVETLPSPAGANSFGSNLSVSADGVAWLTWLETDSDKTTRLHAATLERGSKRWSQAQTLATGRNLSTGTADFPAVSAGRNGHATALWYVDNAPSPETSHLHHGAGYHAVTRATRDGGRTWSPPEKLSRESDLVEFAALTTLADGRVLAVWLDGRIKKARGLHAAHTDVKPAQQLFSRIVGSKGPDVLVDGKVCDCCHTALTAFPDGTALLAYRGRDDDEARDIRVARFRGESWSASRVLNSDDWRINGCPVNGPQLASDGGRVAAVWFTAADSDPRILASYSPDAGGRFLMPLRLSSPTPAPAGRVSTILLHDGAILVSWVDSDGALVLRRVTPDYSAAGPAVSLTSSEHGRIKGFPRLALWRDYRGGSSPVQLLATFTRESPARVETLLVTVPEGELLAAATDCDCSPTPEQLRGYPIRGSIVAVDRARGTLTVKHAEVPGMFTAGSTEFRVDAAALTPPAQPGREFLARFESSPDGWRLFDVRLIASGPR